jgi:hypothetical protein
MTASKQSQDGTVKVKEWEYLGSIPGFFREVDDSCAFISYYAASNGNLLQTFP